MGNEPPLNPVPPMFAAEEEGEREGSVDGEGVNGGEVGASEERGRLVAEGVEVDGDDEVVGDVKGCGVGGDVVGACVYLGEGWCGTLTEGEE